MANITFDTLVTGLNQYAVKSSPQLHTLINENLEWEDPSRYRPADYSWVERNASIDDVLQPYQAEIGATKSATTWSGVETHLEDGMILTKFEQRDLDQFVRTQMYANRQLSKDVTEQDLYGIIMNQLVIPKLRENLNNVGFNGVRVDPTAGTPGTSLGTFTGYNKRFTDAITANKITEIPTSGAATVYDKAVLMAKGVPAWLRFKAGKIYMSKSKRQEFINEVIAANKYTYVPGLDESSYAIVPGYNKVIIGKDSMEGSDRMILEIDGYPSMLVVTDMNLSALPTLRVHKTNMFTMHVYAPLRRGYGLTYYETTFVSDEE